MAHSDVTSRAEWIKCGEMLLQRWVAGTSDPLGLSKLTEIRSPSGQWILNIFNGLSF